MPKVIIRQTTAPDGTVNVNKSDSTLISAVTVASGGVAPFNVADSTAVLKDSLGTVISTTPIKATESADITAPNVDLEINGVNEGSFASGSTIDLQLTDGTNPVVPDSVAVVGDVVTATLPAPTTGWVRNPDWLPLPEITAADNRFVGLFLVFENEYNQFTIWTQNATVDLGDGNIIVTNNTNQVHVYDYAAIASPVYQYYDGRNYKQVIVDITSTHLTAGAFYIDQPTGINNGGCINFVDISISLQGCSVVLLSSSRVLNILEQIKVYKLGTSNFPRLNTTIRLASIFIEPALFTTNPVGGNTFIRAGIFNSIDSITTTLTNVNNMFFESKVEIMNIDAPNATLYQQVFFEARELIKSISTIPSATNISLAYSTSNSLRVAELYGLGNVTNANGLFSGVNSLTRVILSALRIGFTVANNNLTAQALNDLFTSLGTASGSQTVIVTGNPGAATCDTTIATAKGFTVTI